MQNKTKISSENQKVIVYVFLTLVVLAVFWQVNHYDFLILDDNIYVTENPSLKAGFTPGGLKWAFTTIYADFWHPVTWLSLMLDYKLFGLNPGGYHATNVILHLLCSLLLFTLFYRMTGEIWKSALVASLFAIHPLCAETVAWIALRRDLLCALFSILTLYLYVYYTEKTGVKRYAAVMFCFIAALASKPMAVTLPVVMILLDYWPLNRFASCKDNVFLWQMKEKSAFFVISAVFSVITLYAHAGSSMTRFSPASRIANAPVAFMTYLDKIFRPYDMAVLQLLPDKIPVPEVITAILIILALTVAVIAAAKRFPCFFAGWLWYAITIAPVLGIIQINSQAVTYHYTYLPSVGIYVMIAWGAGLFFPLPERRMKILFPAALVLLALLATLTWKQCGHWRNSTEILNQALRVSKENRTAYNAVANILYNNIGNRLAGEGKFNEAISHFNEAIRICPSCGESYTNRGNVYASMGLYDRAIADYDETIRLKPDHADAYNNRGNAFAAMGRPQDAIEDYSSAIRLKPDIADYRSNRGNAYAALGRYRNAIEDLDEAVRMDDASVGAYNNRGIVYIKLGRYPQAVEDFSRALSIREDCFEAYFNRGNAYSAMKQYGPAIADFNRALALKADNSKVITGILSVYFKSGNIQPACLALKTSCDSGDCRILQAALSKGYCR